MRVNFSKSQFCVRIRTKTFGLKFGHLIAEKKKLKLQKDSEMVGNSHFKNDEKVANDAN